MNDIIIGTKIEMTQVFEEDGTVVPVTRVLIDKDFSRFNKGDVVTVIGVSKGKRFAGVVKRWSMAGGPKTHGQSDRTRAIGSIGGGTDPARVFKGKKMPGRMGQHRVTVKNLEIIGIDDERYLLIKGGVPGSRNSKLEIRLLSENKEVNQDNES